VAVKIRLLRMGKIRHPQYRIVVADARTKRDGRAIEYVGIYHPKEDPSRIEVNSDRVQHWLGVGAQPSDAVRAILSKTGDWQKFKGLPAPPPLLVAAPRMGRLEAYEAAAKAAAGVVEPTTKGAKRAAEAKSAEAKSGAAKAEAAKSADAAPAAAAAAPAAAEPAAQEATGSGAGVEG